MPYTRIKTLGCVFLELFPFDYFYSISCLLYKVARDRFVFGPGGTLWYFIIGVEKSIIAPPKWNVFIRLDYFHF